MNPNRIPDPYIVLTDKGREQAKIAGKKLNSYFQKNSLSKENTYTYSSSYVRAKQTCEIVLKEIGLTDYRDDDRLVEQDFGLFDCVEPSEWASEFPLETELYKRLKEFKGAYYVRYPLGESPLDVSLRVRSFIDTMFRDFERHDIENFIIFSHGITIRTFIRNWFLYPPEWLQEEKNPLNCSTRLIARKNVGNSMDYGYL